MRRLATVMTVVFMVMAPAIPASAAPPFEVYEEDVDEWTGTLGLSYAFTDDLAIDLGLVVGLGGDAGNVRVVAGLTRVFSLFSAR